MGSSFQISSLLNLVLKSYPGSKFYTLTQWPQYILTTTFQTTLSYNAVQNRDALFHHSYWPSPWSLWLSLYDKVLISRGSYVLDWSTRYLFMQMICYYIYIYISDPRQSIPQLLQLLSKFGRISGYEVNIRKSELMPISSSHERHITSQPFKVNLNKMKYLGVWVTGSYK